MPPKRKAGASDATASNSRTTRASKRKSTVAESDPEEEAPAAPPVASSSKSKAPAKKVASAKKSSTTAISDSDLSALEDEPPKKKAKTKKAVAAVGKAATKVVEIEDDSEDVAPEPVKKAKAKAAPVKKAVPVKKATKKKKKVEPEPEPVDDTPEAEEVPPPAPEPVKEVEDNSPFTMKKLDKLYQTYADAEDPKEISGEGLERMFGDLNVDMETIVPFILPFDLRASKMGSLTKEEFYRLQLSEIDSIPKLRKYLRAMTADVETSSFDRFYNWLYPFCLEEGQKTMGMEMAHALWTIILKNKNAVAADFVDYLGSQAKYKGVNKDAWKQVNEFVHEVTLGPESEGRKLVGFSEESAFPVIIDEYAEWVARGRVDKKEEED